MYFIGGPLYTNGRADDPMPGTARSGHHARVNAQEVGVKVAPSSLCGDLSPETPPDAKGRRRGSRPVSAYPERGSNPHGASHQGILSPCADGAGSVRTYPYRGETGSDRTPNLSGSSPNGNRQSPDLSPDLLKRIRRTVAFSPTGCWIWQGAKQSKGYASIRIGGKQGRTYSVHRLVAEAYHGAIPAGGMVCHTCDVRDCVNPAHLYIGTAETNAADAVQRGRAVNPLACGNSAKTHCPQGHPYSAENTIQRPAGDRLCRICKRVSDRRAHEKRVAARQALP